MSNPITRGLLGIYHKIVPENDSEPPRQFAGLVEVTGPEMEIPLVEERADPADSFYVATEDSTVPIIYEERC